MPIALGVAVLFGVVWVGYRQIYPEQGRAAPHIGASRETPPVVASPYFATVSQEPSAQLVTGLPQLGHQPPPEEPGAPPTAQARVAPAAAEGPVPVVPETGIPQAFVHAISTGPANDVFVVRFDSKLPDLTPSGLRALDAALRAASKGRKVHIEIAGCATRDGMQTAVDCAALTRALKSILIDRRVDRPADLIASQYPPTIVFPW